MSLMDEEWGRTSRDEMDRLPPHQTGFGPHQYGPTSAETRHAVGSRGARSIDYDKKSGKQQAEQNVHEQRVMRGLL